MASDSPAHDFLLPRLATLVSDAEKAGFPREVAVAVLIDLVTSPRFDTAEPDPKADSEPRVGWERGPESVALVGGMPPNPPAVDARDEADFVKPMGWNQPG